MSLQSTLCRRRFITICATAAAYPAAAALARTMNKWRGFALGAEASIILGGVDDTAASDVVRAVESEVERLERIFSLYRSDSALSNLNRDGFLRNPPAELLEVLSLSNAIHIATAGAFDPTIQGLWTLYAEAAIRKSLPEKALVRQQLDRTGFQHVAFDPTEIRYRREGISLTLNGIAQGYIADRIKGMLQARKFSNILINMGEIAALGPRPDGTPWRVGVESSDGKILKAIHLSNRCLATSAPMGTTFGSAENAGHILDPRTGSPATTWATASVSAEKAAIADGLSTAFCLMPRPAIDHALSAFEAASIEALS